MKTAVFNYRSLPLSERIELVGDIWDSIAEESTAPVELSVEQRAELHRRLAAHHADPGSSIPWAQVHASLFHAQS